MPFRLSKSSTASRTRASNRSASAVTSRSVERTSTSSIAPSARATPARSVAIASLYAARSSARSCETNSATANRAEPTSRRTIASASTSAPASTTSESARCDVVDDRMLNAPTTRSAIASAPKPVVNFAPSVHARRTSPDSSFTRANRHASVAITAVNTTRVAANPMNAMFETSGNAANGSSSAAFPACDPKGARSMLSNAGA